MAVPQQDSSGCTRQTFRSRLQSRVRRSVAPQATLAMLRDPVFIVSAPRSGSSLLFEALRRYGDLFYHREEATNIWWEIFPFTHAEASDWLDPQSATEMNAGRLGRGLYQEAVTHRLARAPGTLRPGHFLGTKTIAYLEKTIANTFHLDWIDRAMPQARFVFLQREPCATVASMIEGWDHDRRFVNREAMRWFSGHGFTHTDRWCYPAPPRWHAQATSTIPQLCAWSWVEHSRCAREFFQKIDPSRYIVARYEDLITDPEGSLTRMAAMLAFRPVRGPTRVLQSLPSSWTTISPPDPAKWRKTAYDQVAAVAGLLATEADALGYGLPSDIRESLV